MTRRQRRTLTVAIAALVVGVLAWQLLTMQRPDRVFFRNTEATRAAEARESVYRLTEPEATIGRLGDVRITSGIESGVVATLERVPAEEAGEQPSWRVVASGESTQAVRLNGDVFDQAPLSDGDVLVIGDYEIRFGTGPEGFAAFYDWWESSTVTHQFLSPQVAQESFPIIAKAFPVSLAIVLVSFAFAIPFGLILSFMKMARTRWARWPATIYVDIIRGTPLFLQILLVFFGLPLMPAYKTLTETVPWLNQAGLFGITNTLYMRAYVVLSLNSAAYMAEIFRAGIQSIHKGQMEAARSLGMSTPQAMAYVIIPQTVRRILPTMMSEFILLFKDTALLAAVGLAEMALKAKEISAAKFNTTPYMLAAGFYLVVTIPLGRFVAGLESRLAEAEGGGGGAREALMPEPIESEHAIAPGDSTPKTVGDRP
ncbi:MAG: ABC transporter permease subunit [Actinomycetota bacterium]|nr:ABC transporter permease subunit [Actinomycetota bacterium]